METLTIFGVIALSALIHTSFQLGVSMVTLLHGHASGKTQIAKRTFRLISAFLAGTIVMVSLLVTTGVYLAEKIFTSGIPYGVWFIIAGITGAIGLSVWFFYYRRGEGTSLWVPRSLARFLSKRIHSTKLSAEAFSLGLTSVIAEIMFIMAPLVVAILMIVTLDQSLQLLAIGMYIVISSMGMLIFTVLIGSGHNVSHIQKWREVNKRFIQFSGGSAMVVLAFYLYVSQVVTPLAIMGIGG